MAKQHASWSFRSNHHEFDGERITKEAQAAGIELLHIQRDGSSAQLIMTTRRYMGRLCAQCMGDVVDGIRKDILPEDYCIPRLDCRGLFVAWHSHTRGAGKAYDYVRNIRPHDPSWTVDDIHEELVRRENTLKRTHVRGFA